MEPIRTGKRRSTPFLEFMKGEREELGVGEGIPTLPPKPQGGAGRGGHSNMPKLPEKRKRAGRLGTTTTSPLKVTVLPMEEIVGCSSTISYRPKESPFVLLGLEVQGRPILQKCKIGFTGLSCELSASTLTILRTLYGGIRLDTEPQDITVIYNGDETNVFKGCAYLADRNVPGKRVLRFIIQWNADRIVARGRNPRAVVTLTSGTKFRFQLPPPPLGHLYTKNVFASLDAAGLRLPDATI